MFEIVAFLVTIIAGVLAEATVGVQFNMPGFGVIIAVAVMGAFILWSVRYKK